MQGNINLVTTEKEIALRVGMVAMVPADEQHQFRNVSADETAKMICLVPIEYQK